MRDNNPKLHVIEGGKGNEVTPDLSYARVLNEELRQRRKELYQSVNEYVQSNIATIIMREIPEIDEKSPKDLIAHSAEVVNEMIEELDRYINSKALTEIIKSVHNDQGREQLLRLSADLKRLLRLLGKT